MVFGFAKGTDVALPESSALKHSREHMRIVKVRCYDTVALIGVRNL